MRIFQRTMVALLIILCVSALGKGDDNICFEGKIENMAPQTFVSGVIVAYHLVRYKIIKVTKGQYTQNHIVVDHLILSGKELDKFRPGDRACVCVEKQDEIQQRWEVKGIREPGEKVPWYFIAKELRKGHCEASGIEK